MFIRSRRFLRAASATAFVFTLSALGSTAVAEWTTLSLPPLAQSYATYRAAHTPEGLLVYGSNNALDLQTSFGSAPLNHYSQAGTWFPSDVAVFGATFGAIGSGDFSGGSISLFDPSNLATAFTPIAGVDLQSYSLEFRDAAGLYVGGANGSESTPFGKMHSLSYVSLDGAVNKVIVDNISMFSADFAVDLEGNLLVANNDNGGLYRFTPAQITAAIAGAPLNLASGEQLTTLVKKGSLAVDGLGRVWSAGFEGPGIDVFDPATGEKFTFYPQGGSEEADNANYIVTTFQREGESYVGYINAAGASAGSALTYGYDRAEALVPEPSSALLLMGGAAFVVARRRSRAI